METKWMLAIVTILVIGTLLWSYSHPGVVTKDVQCQHDCTNNWTNVKDWTCIESCMRQ